MVSVALCVYHCMCVASLFLVIVHSKYHLAKEESAVKMKQRTQNPK